MLLINSLHNFSFFCVRQIKV